MASGKDRLIDALKDVPNSLGAMGTRSGQVVKGSGEAGVRAGSAVGGGLIGAGKSVANAGANITASVVEGANNFTQKYPAIAAIAVIALAWNPVKNFFKNRKAKKEVAALQHEQTGIMSEIAARRQAAAETSATLGQFNPADGNAVGRVQAGRGIGGVPTPQ